MFFCEKVCFNVYGVCVCVDNVFTCVHLKICACNMYTDVSFSVYALHHPLYMVRTYTHKIHNNYLDRFINNS